jgi:hypothetical protein
MKISKLFNYSTDMCLNGQGTTIVSHDLKGMYTILYLYLLMPKPKRVTNSFWIIIFMWSMKRLDMYAQESPIFFFWVGGEGRRGALLSPMCFLSIPIEFSRGSLQISDIFAIAPHF